MQHTFTCERDSEGYPINMDVNTKSMARLVDCGKWTWDNHEEMINYFHDNIIIDEEKLKMLQETNQYRTEKYDKDLKDREFRSAVNDLLITKNLTPQQVTDKIEEFKELRHPVTTIEKLELFRGIVELDDENLKKERFGNYIDKYL